MKKVFFTWLWNIYRVSEKEIYFSEKGVESHVLYKETFSLIFLVGCVCILYYFGELYWMSMLKDLEKKILGSTCVCVAHLLLHAYSWRTRLNNIPIYFLFNWPLKMYFVIVERRIWYVNFYHIILCYFTWKGVFFNPLLYFIWCNTTP